jgi:hypothetical protein
VGDCELFSTTPNNSNRSLAAQSNPCQTLVVDEIGFSILKYREKTPVLAVCARCQLKFLTPSQMMKDWEAASEYLWRKYSNHRCAPTRSCNEGRTHDPLSTFEVNTPEKQRARAI